MTQDQLEQLAELITQKIMDEFDKRIAERYQAATPEEFHHSIDIFGNVKHVSKKDILNDCDEIILGNKKYPDDIDGLIITPAKLAL